MSKLSKWLYFRCGGDIAIYEKCDKCGYEHCCSTTEIQPKSFIPKITNRYAFCPICGDPKDISESADSISVNNIYH